MNDNTDVNQFAARNDLRHQIQGRAVKTAFLLAGRPGLTAAQRLEFSVAALDEITIMANLAAELVKLAAVPANLEADTADTFAEMVADVDLPADLA
jgi:hypothetical protein